LVSIEVLDLVYVHMFVKGKFEMNSRRSREIRGELQIDLGCYANSYMLDTFFVQVDTPRKPVR